MKARLCIVIMLLWACACQGALVVTLTKLEPRLHHDNLVTIGFNVVLTDNDVERVNTTVTDTMCKTVDLESATDRFITLVQRIIDKYWEEKAIYTSAKYNALTANVAAGIDTTEPE